MHWKCPLWAVLVPFLGQAPADEVQDVLDREGLVVVDKPLTQGFSAYIGPEHPIFVTSDSLLMAYHRLLEESIAQDEIADLAGHLKFWPGLWPKLPVKPLSGYATDIEGHRRCRLVVATTLRLLTGRLPDGLTEAETKDVEAEVGRVEKGEGNVPPEWLGTGKAEAPFVSYAAFRPTSFHQGVGALERYYRFRKWLQEMPLDLRDSATESMAEHLAISLNGMDVDRLVYEIEPLFFSRSCLFGPMLGDAWREVEPDRLAEWRADLREKFAERQDWRFLASIIPAGSEIARELLPTGLVERTPEVLGAALGNPVAAGLVGPDLGDTLAIGRKDLENTWGIPSVWKALNAAPDPRAPDLMRSEAWQRKQLNATLGSWAEYRYALQLASREDASWGGLSNQLPGFVEPVPDFYNNLGGEAERLASAGNLGPKWEKATELRLAMLLEKLVGHLRKAEASQDVEEQSISANPDFFNEERHQNLLNRLFPKAPSEDDFEKTWDWMNAEERAVVMARLQEFLRQYWSGDEPAAAMIRKESADLKDDLTPRLWRLASTCFRLEAMAERQLSGQPWRESDIAFLEGYGAHLGWLMFYEGNSYLSPDDDAPRIARYATDASPAGTRVHHAAVARPRLLLIHYPDADGKPVLCQGAVYAFRNVELDRTPGRDEWNSDSEKSRRPAWMDAITATPKPAEGK